MRQAWIRQIKTMGRAWTRSSLGHDVTVLNLYKKSPTDNPVIQNQVMSMSVEVGQEKSLVKEISRKRKSGKK